ncbi:MAG: peptide chain release factor N(5)-glutamine methyltransferase [Luteimonas sp.]
MDTSVGDRLDALLRAAQLRIDAADAQLLLAHACACTRSWLYAHGEDVVDAATHARFLDLVERRAAGEPVAYLIGTRGFWNFDLRVTPDTLIPRAETELLVEIALAHLPLTGQARIADLGTGSGAIAIALARERQHSRVVATDASEATLMVARMNAISLGIDSISFMQGDWCHALGNEHFDMIVSNPPYIAADDPHLRQGDLRFEPGAALASGLDGLDAIRKIIEQSPTHLVSGGWLLLEHGSTQAEAVRVLLANAGFADIDSARDLEHRERVTYGSLAV